MNVEEACKFFQTMMSKLQTRGIAKDKHSKEKKVGGDVLEVSRGGIKSKIKMVSKCCVSHIKNKH